MDHQNHQHHHHVIMTLAIHHSMIPKKAMKYLRLNVIVIIHAQTMEVRLFYTRIVYTLGESSNMFASILYAQR